MCGVLCLRKTWAKGNREGFKVGRCECCEFEVKRGWRKAAHLLWEIQFASDLLVEQLAALALHLPVCQHNTSAHSRTHPYDPGTQCRKFLMYDTLLEPCIYYVN
jgi:hypothetical protein